MNIYTTVMFSMSFVLGSCVVDSGTKAYEGRILVQIRRLSRGLMFGSWRNIECQEAECITFWIALFRIL